jgi:hypothetical protein
MTTIELVNDISNDCKILLERAFKNEIISAFGEDGHGLYGECTFAQYFKISDVEFHSNETCSSGKVKLYLHGFDSINWGHVATDNNVRNCRGVILCP